jgi:uncharacterized membrane protein YkgB
MQPSYYEAQQDQGELHHEHRDHPSYSAHSDPDGVVPAWPHSRGWSYGPSGVLGVILVILIILLLMGRL